MFQTPEAITCPHEKREYVGTDATAHFYRCETCGAVIVIQRGLVWQITPPAAPD